MITQIDFFKVVGKIMMGNQSLLPRKLLDLRDNVIENKPVFNLCQSSNLLFATKFLFADDPNVQRWLDSWMQAMDRVDKRDKLISPDGLVEQVQL